MFLFLLRTGMAADNIFRFVAGLRSVRRRGESAQINLAKFGAEEMKPVAAA